MRKILFFITLLALATFTFEECKSSKGAASKDVCSKQAAAGEHCCYLDAKEKDGEQTNRCIEITKEQYDKIKDSIKSYESDGAKVNSLDCSSSYLKFGLIALLAALI